MKKADVKNIGFCFFGAQKRTRTSTPRSAST
jgi:hypothetical protein